MTLDEILRREGGQVLATLVRLTGDIGIAEDALQEAVIVAHSKWTDDDMPENPAAWLTTNSTGSTAVGQGAGSSGIARPTTR